MTHHHAHVDRRPDGEYIIQTYSRSAGPRVADGPLVSLDRSASAEELGTEALAAVLRSRTGVPGYIEGDEFAKELLHHVGLKTYGQYMKGTRSIEVFADFDGELPTTFELIPYDNQGARGGFSEMAAARRIVNNPSPLELGEAILAALEVATG